MTLSRPVIILSTAPRGMGDSIAQVLVEEGHAACVNIIEIRSLFRWEGVLSREEEDLMVIKTESDKATGLMERVREIHPYQIPEMVVIPINGGYPPYLQWLHEEVQR